MSRIAVAWDVDGTLVDSEPRHHRALVAASRDLGVDLSDLPGDRFRGEHMRDVWAVLRPRYAPDLAMAPWIDAINTAYLRDPELMLPMPGAVETVDCLAALGVAQVCVSNSSRKVVLANIDALGIGRFLSGVITLDDVSAGKPDPEPYRAACRLLGLGPDRVTAVEDSETGLHSARAAGLRVLRYDPHGTPDRPADDVVIRLGDVVLRVASGCL